jgi:hypothetical protein
MMPRLIERERLGVIVNLTPGKESLILLVYVLYSNSTAHIHQCDFSCP